MITTQLNHERVGLAAWSGFLALYDEVAAWAAAATTPTARAVIDLAVGAVGPGPVPGRARGHVPPQLAHGGRRRCGRADGGRLLGGQGVRTERTLEIYRLLLGIVGAAGYLAPGSPGAVLRGRLEATAARRRSTPSAAASTRSSARSWPWPAWA